MLNEWDVRGLSDRKKEAVRKAHDGEDLDTKDLLVLNANRLNTDGTPFVPSNLKSIDAKKQLEFVKQMRCNLTGVDNGDVLLGISKNNRDMRVQYAGPTIPPGNAIGRLTEPKARALFYNKLGALDRFSHWTPEQRRKYCEANSYVIQRDTTIAMFEESRLSVLSPGRMNDVTGLKQSEIAEIMSRSWSGKGFTNYMEEALGRGTLILLQGMWKVVPSARVQRTLAQGQTVFDVAKGELYELKNLHQDQEVITPQGASYGFLVDRYSIELTWDEVWLVAAELLEGEGKHDTEDEETEWKDFLVKLTPGELKSMLQKLIRYRARQVVLPSKALLPVHRATLMCAAALLIHPGSFVPNLQIFATGLHSVTKRLGVICFEDTRLGGNTANSLLMMAWLSQLYREWKPSRNDVRMVMRAVCDALDSEEAYLFAKQSGAKYKAVVLSPDTPTARLASGLVDAIGSFDGDCKMIRHIVHQPYLTKRMERPDTMPFYHFVDQHCAPNIGYLCGKADHTDPRRPFGPFFRRVFNQVSGINPRRGPIPVGDEVDHIKDVQWLYAQFRYLYKPKVLPAYGQQHFELSYPLDDGWLAGIIGPLELMVERRKVYVTVNVRDIHEQVVMFKPTRTTADDSLQLTEGMRKEAIQKWRVKMRKGVSATRVVPPLIPQLVGKRITYDGQQYRVGQLPWNLFRVIQSSVPYAKRLTYNVRKVVSRWGMLVRQRGVEDIMDHFRSCSRDVQQRIVFFLSGYRTEIRLESIGREGDGQNVTVFDALAHDHLLRICHHAPAALQIDQPSRFRSPWPPLLWQLRYQMASHVASEMVEQKGGWPALHTPAGRTAWDHQKEALEEMKANYTRGFQGSFMHMEVGSGKTSVLLWFLMWLQEEGRLPEYIVYSAPYSALMSVAEEMERFGLPIDYVSSSRSEQVERDYNNFLNSVGQKGYKKKYIPGFVDYIKAGQSFPQLRPFRVSLIEHDSLRRGTEEVLGIVPKAIFVMDEVHKALAETQRTANAVQMARLAHHFVAFTGTAVINNKFESLIQWLDMITPFPLNKQNFWVSINAMIARNFKTGITREQKLVQVEMKEKHYKDYQLTVPHKLGGIAVKINFRAAVDLCYQACDVKMVLRTKELWKEGVVLVTRDRKHQVKLAQMLKKVVDPKLHHKILVLNRDVGSISLTDENVKTKRIVDYRVVIVPMQHNAGYNLTRLGCMIDSVYLSNEASRQQMRGRIDRIGQSRDRLLYETYACGLLLNIHEHYIAARSLVNAIKSAAKELEIDPKQMK